MNNKRKIILIIILSVCLVSSSFTLLLNDHLFGGEDYLLNKRIPGIVEGSAKMIDTQSYLTKNNPTQSKVKLAIQCNNSNYLRIAIGYKNPEFDLLDASAPTKEILLWRSGDRFPSRSSGTMEDYSSKTQINREWDLLALGFNTREFVQADARIWYLKIKDIRSEGFGYERNITVEQDGKIVTLPDYRPNINYLESFQLQFNDLIFETQLHPFFDGSREVVVPIRGVHHELINLKQDNPYQRSNNIGLNGWDITTTSPNLGNNYWALVFGTAKYHWQSFMDDSPQLVMECRSFIMGCYYSQAPSCFKQGLFDYGWRVVYCMDGNEQQTDMATCETTDPDILKSMFDYVNQQLGFCGRLITYIACHGLSYYGKHITITGASRCWAFGWTDVMRLNDYEDKVNAITNDGTKFFLWLRTCHGNGADSFSSSIHHYCLESWSFRPDHIDVKFGYTVGYKTFNWVYERVSGQVVPLCEGALFFKRAAEGPFIHTVTTIGHEIQIEYNTNWFEDKNSRMYIQSTWGDHIFYINWG
ncbi:MAG: hypothetical protein GF308_07340 [Candidatus Heimdallarchaeota archaeon]|nr:hypothetical protein [Candidatus Heimdallarchaeota archaeon]